ncbi:transglutaminase domain-containing protein, partial [Candidatus Gottesmanbacteria bacterium]|nr:transglutaminase domain-containing protein [Candidatus Gottesmanbacteria bacterium]
RASVAITLNPNPNYTESAPTEGSTKPDQYWETENAKIISLANAYRTPRAIYDYVVSALSYNYDRVNQNPIRKGAVAALANPTTAVCMEFTDLFIAVARAAGIPAREVVGFAYTTNTKLRPLSLLTDVLHAWPEYYDTEKKTWVPIDPTWAKTTGGVNYFDKLDFNHIAFTIHGSSSTYPYPAGSYRKSGGEGKTVQVRFATVAPDAETGKLTTQINFPKQITAGMEARGLVTVTNTSGVAIPKADISIQSTPVDVSITRSLTDMPPFSSTQIPITLTIPSAWGKTSGRITVQANNASAQAFFTVQPFYGLLIPAAVAFIALLLLAWILLARPHVIWRTFKKS